MILVGSNWNVWKILWFWLQTVVERLRFRTRVVLLAQLHSLLMYLTSRTSLR